MPETDPPANTPPNKQAGAPQCVEAVLTASDLDDLFRDLAACAELQHIAVKDQSGRATADTVTTDLVSARLLIDQPHVTALQLRYRYNGDLWIDTLTHQEVDYHLLRVCH